MATTIALAACSGADLGGSGETSFFALTETIDGVYLYPPLAPQPTPTGAPDASLAGSLRVVLESESATRSTGVVATFDAQTSPTLRYMPAFGVYLVDVPAAAYFRDATLSYRFRILLAEREIGRSDLSSQIFTALAKNPGLTVGVKVWIQQRPAPTITSILPASTEEGPSFALTVQGTNFFHDSVVRIGAVDQPTTFISATALTVTVPAAIAGVAGQYPITVFTPAPGGGTSNTVSLEVRRAPDPLVLTSILPSSATAGDPTFVLTLVGTGFGTASVATFDGHTLATSFVSSNVLTAAVLATMIAAPGSVSVRVEDPRGATNALPFTILSPAPVITALNPDELITASGDVVMTISGSGFMPTSVVTLDGVVVTSTFVSPSELVITVPSGTTDLSGPHAVTVTNAGPGGGTSSATFQVTNPAPLLEAVDPGVVFAGSGETTLVLSGSGFIPGSSATIGGVPVPTTYLSATELLATLPANLAASPGTLPVVVTNPGPGGGTSAPVDVAVVTRAPVLTAVVPGRITAGGPDVEVTLVGANFFPGAVASFDGTTLAATWVSSSELQVIVPAALTSAAATLEVRVVNPSPTEGASNALPFQIDPAPPVGGYDTTNGFMRIYMSYSGPTTIDSMQCYVFGGAWLCPWLISLPTEREMTNLGFATACEPGDVNPVATPNGGLTGDDTNNLRHDEVVHADDAGMWGGFGWSQTKASTMSGSVTYCIPAWRGDVSHYPAGSLLDLAQWLVVSAGFADVPNQVNVPNRIDAPSTYGQLSPSLALVLRGTTYVLDMQAWAYDLISGDWDHETSYYGVTFGVGTFEPQPGMTPLRIYSSSDGPARAGGLALGAPAIFHVRTAWDAGIYNIHIPSPEIWDNSPLQGPVNVTTIETVTGVGFDSGTIFVLQDWSNNCDLPGYNPCGTILTERPRIISFTPTEAVLEMPPLPADRAGYYDIIAMYDAPGIYSNPDWANGYAPNGFSYTTRPWDMVSIEPGAGPISLAQEVTIRGDFGDLTDADFVYGFLSIDGQWIGSMTVYDVTPTTAKLWMPDVSGIRPDGGWVDFYLCSSDWACDRIENGYLYVAVDPLGLDWPTSPAVGSTAGGYTVTITGFGFTPDMTMTWDGQPITFTYVDDHTVTVVAPPGQPGQPYIYAYREILPGVSISAYTQFMYIGPFTVTSASPNVVYFLGGTGAGRVTVHGTGFAQFGSVVPITGLELAFTDDATGLTRYYPDVWMMNDLQIIGDDTITFVPPYQAFDTHLPATDNVNVRSHVSLIWTDPSQSNAARYNGGAPGRTIAGQGSAPFAWATAPTYNSSGGCFAWGGIGAVSTIYPNAGSVARGMPVAVYRNGYTAEVSTNTSDYRVLATSGSTTYPYLFIQAQNAGTNPRLDVSQDGGVTWRPVTTGVTSFVWTCSGYNSVVFEFAPQAAGIGAVLHYRVVDQNLGFDTNTWNERYGQYMGYPAQNNVRIHYVNSAPSGSQPLAAFIYVAVDNCVFSPAIVGCQNGFPVRFCDLLSSNALPGQGRYFGPTSGSGNSSVDAQLANLAQVNTTPVIDGPRGLCEASADLPRTTCQYIGSPTQFQPMYQCQVEQVGKNYTYFVTQYENTNATQWSAILSNPELFYPGNTPLQGMNVPNQVVTNASTQCSIYVSRNLLGGNTDLYKCYQN